MSRSRSRSRARVRLVAVPLIALLASSLVSCSNDDDPSETTLTVLAAASLTETFTALADEFEAANDTITVRLAFDSSAALASQAVEGAPADLLATADATTMQQAVDGGAVDGAPSTFATNTLVLVVPPDNPQGITSLTDLERDAVDYVVCVDTAPCGRAAAAVLADGGVDHAPASLETDVKAVLQKVVSGEADAGLVYVTDAEAAGDAVLAIPVPEAESEVLSYPIAVLAQAREGDLAQRFIDLVLSAKGQAILAEAGFGKP